jgi:adenylate cyclase
VISRQEQVIGKLALAGALALAALWGGALGAWHIAGRGSFLDRIEGPTIDWRLLISGPKPAPDAVVIVAIDDATVQRAGAYPVPRKALASLLRRLAEGGAKAIAFDMLFLDPSTDEADRALADAMRQTPCATGAAAQFASGESFAATRLGAHLSAMLPLADRLLMPIPPIASACGPGLVNLSADAGGVPRYMPLLIRVGDRIAPSLALGAATAASGVDAELEANAIRIGARRVRTDIGYSLPLRFYGPRGAFRTISARAVIEGDAADVRGRVVLIGVTAFGTADTFATAFDPVFPGVEVFATAIAQIISGQGLVRDQATRSADLTASVVLPVLTALALAAPRIGLGVLLATLPLAAWCILAVLAFDLGYWLSIAEPVAATLPPAIAFGSLRLWLEQRAKRRFHAQRETLRRFHSPAIIAVLANDPDFLQQPLEQQAVVLFVDLSRFTTLSERLGPARTRHLLKEFHSIVDAQVTQREGFVLSFMGDGAMAIFGLPYPRADDPARALDAAFGLSSALQDWSATPVGGDARAFGARIGLHYGPVVLSRLGGETHQHITATGDTVNVASRLMEIGKAQGYALVFSDDAVLAAKAKDARLQSFDGPTDVSIRGRIGSMKVWMGRPQTDGALERRWLS